MQRETQTRPVGVRLRLQIRMSKLELARRRVDCLVEQLASHRAMTWHGSVWKEVEEDCIQRLALAQIELERRERRGSGGRRESGRG